jgi:hypothetical protein
MSKKVSNEAENPALNKGAVSGSARKWWNSLTKAERRELRIKQIGETAFWNSFRITFDEIVDLYKHYR